MIRWWPPIALAAVVVLGLVVGKGSTPLDVWFEQFGGAPVRELAALTNPWLFIVLTVVSVVVVAFAVAKHWWRFAVVATVLPPGSYVLVQLLKPLFGRMKGTDLAYPSGHLTVTTVVFGLAVVAAGGATWCVVGATCAVAATLGVVGATFHYFTDTVGGVLLGSALVCLAALSAELDRRQPRVRSASHRGHSIAT